MAMIAFKIAAGWAVFLALIFVPAGTLRWAEAWGFVAVYLVFGVYATAWLARHNPKLLNERISLTMPVKGWDKLVLLLFTVAAVAEFVLIGFDAVRFGWSTVPAWAKAVGFVGVVISLVLIFLAMKENPFLTKIVVVQRDHHVVTTGPYAIVRHPMYTGAVLLFLSVPLALGSLWSLVPGGFMAALLAVRTVLEERTLSEELPGYVEYKQKTRYRLLPWVW